MFLPIIEHVYLSRSYHKGISKSRYIHAWRHGFGLVHAAWLPSLAYKIPSHSACLIYRYGAITPFYPFGWEHYTNIQSLNFLMHYTSFFPVENLWNTWGKKSKPSAWTIDSLLSDWHNTDSELTYICAYTCLLSLWPHVIWWACPPKHKSKWKVV